MDPTAPRNVAVTTEASATGSPGSVAALRDTQGTGEWCWPGVGVAWGGPGAAAGCVARLIPTRCPGAVRSAPWAASGRTVLRLATAPRAPAASRPTARVCANTASLGTAAPNVSAPTASTASAARCPAPATRNTVSSRPRALWSKGLEANGRGLRC